MALKANVTAIETKTFYRVSVTLNDFIVCAREYRKSLAAEECWHIGRKPGVFKGMDESMDASSIVFGNWTLSGDVTSAEWMAKMFGFDGVENVGHYHKASNTIRMTFYNEGACI